MNDEIKEKLLKGCGKELVHYKPLTEPLICGEVLNDEIILCPTCKAKLQQHEETSKAKDEEELKFLFEMNSKYKLFNGNVFMNDMVKNRIDKIKKDLKESEEWK